jgi:hypothetical protein
MANANRNKSRFSALAVAFYHIKRTIKDGDRRLQIYPNDKANHAEYYQPLVITYRL